MGLGACLLDVLLLATAVGAQSARPTSTAAERDRILALAAAKSSSGDPAEAARLLQSVADRFESVRALLQLARLQSDQKNLAGALKSLRQARAIAPNAEEVLSAYAEASLAAAEPLRAIPVLDVLTRLCPTVAQYHYLQGMALTHAGDAVAAVLSLKEAERLEPNQPLTLIALGTALNTRELYADAKPILLRALSLAPDSVDAAATLAEAEEGLGELEAAEAYAQRALAKASGHPTANLVWGMVLMKQDRYAEARDALLKTAAANPASAKAHYQLSLAYARLNDQASSEKHLELYHKQLKETDQRVEEVRRLTGFSTGGMPP